MTEITPSPKTVTTATRANKVPYLEDTTGGFDVAGIDVDDDNYDNGSFIDRDYDVRFLSAISILLENLGPNDIDYTILSTTQDFDDLDADLLPADFTEIEKAETAIVAGSQATGSVEVTGGPSVVATGTLTLVSAVANTFATGTVTCATAIVDDTVTVNGLLYTAVAGSKGGDNTKFSIDTSDTATAADLADSITNDVRAGTSGDQTATSSTDTVTITTDVLGTGGNAITLVSSDGATLAVSGAVLSGGVAADTATVNGLVYTAVAGSKGGDNTLFSIDTSDTAAATDLADSIANDVRVPITVPTVDATATSSIGVVTVTTPLNDGAAGNAVDIVGTANITASAGTLASGVTSTMSSIDVGGVEILSASVNWRTSDTLTGDDVASNINALTTSPNFTAVNVAGVVTITRVGSAPDTSVITSTTATMTSTDANMSGGTKGVSAVTNISRTTPQITAIKIRAKEAAGGSPGKVRGDVKFTI